MWNLKNSMSKKQIVEWWLPNTGQVVKWGDTGQKIQTSSCKTFWGSNVHYCDYS